MLEKILDNAEILTSPTVANVAVVAALALVGLAMAAIASARPDSGVESPKLADLIFKGLGAIIFGGIVLMFLSALGGE